MRIKVINGPNLNMLGHREVHQYGESSLADIIKLTEKKAQDWGLNLDFDWFQSNVEGEIVSEIQTLVGGNIQGLIINPGGYTHTSVAIHDALKMLTLPIIEVHLSNVSHRESWRQVMLTAQAADSIMEGLGNLAYCIAAFTLHQWETGDDSNNRPKKRSKTRA